jgi:hypothetical protein
VCLSFLLLSFKLSSGYLFSPHHVNQDGVQRVPHKSPDTSFHFVIFFPLVELIMMNSGPFLPVRGRKIIYYWLKNAILLLTVKLAFLNTILLLTPKREFYHCLKQNFVVPAKLLLLKWLLTVKIAYSNVKPFQRAPTWSLQSKDARWQNFVKGFVKRISWNFFLCFLMNFVINHGRPNRKWKMESKKKTDVCVVGLRFQCVWGA